jgi:hypothetical protein
MRCFVLVLVVVLESGHPWEFVQMERALKVASDANVPSVTRLGAIIRTSFPSGALSWHALWGHPAQG